MTEHRRPPGRYDEPRQSRRVLVQLVAVLFGLAVAVSVYALYERRTEGRLAHQVRGYEVLSDRAVRVDWEVVLADGERGECLVRARNREGAEAGRAIVAVGPGTGGALRTSHELTTSSRAATGDVVRCRTAPTPRPSP